MSNTPVDPHKQASAWAGGGVLAGLVTIFLPLLQAGPSHLTAGTVQTAVGAGAVLVLGSVGAKIGHSLGLSKAQTTAGVNTIAAKMPEFEEWIAQRPQVQADVAEAKSKAGAALAKFDAFEAQVPGLSGLVANAETIGVNALSDILQGRKIVVSGPDGIENIGIPKVAVSTPPAEAAA